MTPIALCSYWVICLIINLNGKLQRKLHSWNLNVDRQQLRGILGLFRAFVSRELCPNANCKSV